MNITNKEVFEAKRKELEQKRAVLEAKTKRMERDAVYGAEYVYVKGGHIKNEILGFLTVFNYNRAFHLNIKRHISYDETNKFLYLNIYQRKDRDMTKKAKVFVYIHGGGWIGGLPETREGFTTRVASEGYFVVSLFYGHSPFYAHPKPIENIYKAFAYLKKHAEEYNIDTDDIFVGGESAGGHLAAMAGAISSCESYKARVNLDPISREQKIGALVLDCGVYDMQKATTTGFRNIHFYVNSYCGKPISELDGPTREEISPINFVTKDFPPSYVISAEHDRLAILTFDLIAKLASCGVEYEHYHGTGRLAVHAFPIAQALRISKESMKGVKKFLSGHS